MLDIHGGVSIHCSNFFKNSLKITEEKDISRNVLEFWYFIINIQSIFELDV